MFQLIFLPTVHVGFADKGAATGFQDGEHQDSGGGLPERNLPQSHRPRPTQLEDVRGDAQASSGKSLPPRLTSHTTPNLRALINT